MASNARKPTMYPTLAIAAAVVVGLSGCGSSSAPASSSTPQPPASSTQTATAGPAQRIVPLGNEPSGTVDLTWNPQSKIITAKLQMAGLTPGSIHAMHIHRGTCAKQADILIPFNDVTADEHGVISSEVDSVVPAESGLTADTSLNVHLASSAQLEAPGSPSWLPISCGDVKPGPTTTLQMAPLPQFGDHPQSQAILTYDPSNKTLTVKARATGLVAGTAHAVHIHNGECDSQGPVVYHLDDLVAGPDGVAETTTVITNVDQAPPTSGWYVNVHLGSHDQIEQNGKPTMNFAPILCGNVTG